MTEIEAIKDNQWFGDSPFFLVIEPDDRSSGSLGVDLDEPGWITTHAEWMRKPGAWFLFHKESARAMLCVIVEEGEQPYFTKRHIGNLMAGSEVVSFGIGKKGRDGEMTRLWILPNGVVCGGDDVEVIASRMLGG